MMSIATTGWMKSTGGSSGTVPDGATASAGGSGPAVPGAGRDSGADDADASAPRPRATSLTLSTTTENPAVAPWFTVYRPTDLCLYGTRDALATLTSPNVCSRCDPGTWKLKFKNLDTLIK